MKEFIFKFEPLNTEIKGCYYSIHPVASLLTIGPRFSLSAASQPATPKYCTPCGKGKQRTVNQKKNGDNGNPTLFTGTGDSVPIPYQPYELS